MNLNDIEIKIKKWTKDKKGNNVVIVDMTILNSLEIRGFTVRYTTTSRSPNSPVWLVNPPGVNVRTKFGLKWFWIVKFEETEFWHEVQSKITQAVIDYTDAKQ